MEQKVEFVRVGEIIFQLDQVLCIGMLESHKAIRVDFKNTSIDSTTVEFKNKVVARKDFDSAVDILCNPWVGQ